MYALPQVCTVLKLKWVMGMAEPTLAILAKRVVEGERTQFFMDIALVKAHTGCRIDDDEKFTWQNQSIEFDLRLRQAFDCDKVTDIDCQNISKRQFLYATVEDGLIRIYSISFENGLTQTPQALTYSISANLESRRNCFCLVRLLPYGKKDLVVASDMACNLHIFKLCGPESLVRPIHVIYNAHAKIISDLAFLTVPVPL